MITRQDSTLFGLHDDTKPTNVNNGTCFVEMDTSAIFFYDAEHEEWLECGAEATGS